MALMRAPWRQCPPLREAAEPTGPDAGYEAALARWRMLSATDPRRLEPFTYYWTEQVRRRFAIESGEIEGLYRLKPAAKHLLERKGVEFARAHHQLQREHRGETLRALLRDEVAALERMRVHAESHEPLDIEEIRIWQRLATAHQGERLVEIESDEGTIARVRVEMRPGEFKTHENLIVAGDTEYEFCRPEYVRRELERILALERAHREGVHPAARCAAWLHAAFNGVHPFPDGNGRTGRLLAAWVYLKRNAHPPLVSFSERREYFETMRRAHRGDIGPLAQLLHESAAAMTEVALLHARENGASAVARGAMHAAREDDA